MEATVPSNTLFDFNIQSLVRPPEMIACFVQRMVRNAQYYAGPEQRTERRYAVSVPVSAIPVDDSFQKTGEPFMALTRDISTKGMSMYHTRRVSEKFLALELTDPANNRLRVVLEVLRCRPDGLFYEIAGRFATKISND